MGCDIHLTVERRNRDPWDPEAYEPEKALAGTWDSEPWLVVPNPIKPCPPYFCGGTGKQVFTEQFLGPDAAREAVAAGAARMGEKAPAYDGRLHVVLAEPEERECPWCRGAGERPVPFFHNRNYETFAMLAGVRNYDGIEPIDEPRGVPRDGSNEYVAEQFRWGVDGHSHSWFTVQELLDVPWEQNVIERHEMCIVGDPAWLNLLATGSPAKPRPGAPEDEVVMVAGGISNDKAEVAFETARAEPDRYTGHPVRIAWRETWAEASEEFVRVVREELAPLGDPREHRVCFFFDN